MKSSELHRLILKNGWVKLRQSGSHIVYIKDGRQSKPVPYHGSHEVGHKTEKEVKQELGLK
ncbi:MAG: type II toxin-antitoxin system HicA family toxin [Rikenellaceae bacterium]|jgi:predicted RNA binding protein YcfA (HicA-like mRNA interferase family)|nr:type II toxin-antitoxin system HicA family toxin [Rikenellaceae bacterium]